MQPHDRINPRRSLSPWTRTPLPQSHSHHQKYLFLMNANDITVKWLNLCPMMLRNLESRGIVPHLLGFVVFISHYPHCGFLLTSGQHSNRSSHVRNILLPGWSNQTPSHVFAKIRTDSNRSHPNVTSYHRLKIRKWFSLFSSPMLPCAIMSVINSVPQSRWSVSAVVQSCWR